MLYVLVFSFVKITFVGLICHSLVATTPANLYLTGFLIAFYFFLSDNLQK